MCMIDGIDSVDRVHTVRIRTARKTHHCEECRRAIAAGESYRYTSGIDGGGYPFSHKLCQHCSVGAEWLSINCGGWVRGGELLEEDLREHGEEYHRADLYRLVIGMRRKWRGLRVPSLPRPIQLGDAR